MTGEELHRRLSEPFAAADVEWRVTKLRNQNSEGLVVPFIDSRAIQNRLDDVVGPFFWRTRFIPWHQYVPKPGKYEDPNESQKTPVSSQLCGLSIYNEERKEWVEKVDGAENTDIEAIKGGISDSFKRAAVIWGVGRYLYEIPARWTSLDFARQDLPRQGIHCRCRSGHPRLDRLPLLWRRPVRHGRGTVQAGHADQLGHDLCI